MNLICQFRSIQYFGARKNVSNALLINKLLNFQVQERQYAARKGKRAALLAAKKEKKAAEAKKPKTPAFQLRKKSAKPELGKKRCTDENWFETQPVDNVWRTALYRGKPYTFNEVLTMYHETHHPSILNKPDAFIYTTVELDVRQKKKSHYLDVLSGVITFPHDFETGFRNNVIAVCKEEDDQMKASEVGALFAGSSALIKRILSGEILSEDFDYIVCHPDSYKELNLLRGILKRNFPSAHNGLLRLDVDKAVVEFSKGMKYVSEHSTVEPDYAWVDVCFGRLNMSDDTLEDNFRYLLNNILKHRPQGVTFPFITKTILWCDNSIERYTVPHEKYLIGYEKTSDQLSSQETEESVAASQS